MPLDAFNQVKAIIGAFSVIVKLRKCSFPALLPIDSILFAVTFEPINKQFPVTLVFALCYTSQLSSDSVVGGEIKFLLLKIKVQFLDFLPCCGCDVNHYFYQSFWWFSVGYRKVKHNGLDIFSMFGVGYNETIIWREAAAGINWQDHGELWEQLF